MNKQSTASNEVAGIAITAFSANNNWTKIVNEMTLAPSHTHTHTTRKITFDQQKHKQDKPTNHTNYNFTLKTFWFSFNLSVFP